MGLHRKVLIPLSHWPTFFLIVGYAVYWIEMFFFRMPGGHTSGLAWVLVLAILAMILRSSWSSIVSSCRDAWRWSVQLPLLHRIGLAISVLFMVLMLAVVFCASLLPPHLPQEFDAINYHISIPRQHLILGSFAHLPWSTADLYFLPVDYALAPFELVTLLPNKFPQFIFFLGLSAVVAGLAFRFSSRSVSLGFWVVASVLGLHMVGVQAGTAMLDLAACYLFVAALDGLLTGNFFLSALEFAFFFWSKSFLPPKIMALVIIMLLLCWILRSVGFRFGWSFTDGGSLVVTKDQWKKWLSVFFVASIFVGGPFVAKSLYYAGTPMFPFGVGMVKPFSGVSEQQYQIIEMRADQALATKDQYGSGRGFKDLLIHFWMIAVPEKGVNNRYDYPVGLVYLLLAGPFVYYIWNGFRMKFFALLPAVIVLDWGFWWGVGSHQTRFLYVPIILMVALVLAHNVRNSIVLKAGILISLLITTVSVYGAHKSDLGRSGYEVLRAEDKQLVDMQGRSVDRMPIILNRYDIAFAGFPVDVKGVDSVFVLEASVHKE
jgi:hypothetical protein